MIVTLTLTYELEDEKSAIDIQREIFDYANKGLDSIVINIDRNRVLE